MTQYAFTLGGEPILFRPEDGMFRADVDGVETWHDRDALMIWSDDERAARGIVRIEVPAQVPSIAERLDILASYRWTKTQTMPAYDGAVNVPADTARSVVTSKVLAAQFMTEEQKLERHAFKLKPGEWRDWNVPDLVTYGLAIGTYMQLCFDREAVLEAEIIAAYPAAVDITIGWPS